MLIMILFDGTNIKFIVKKVRISLYTFCTLFQQGEKPSMKWGFFCEPCYIKNCVKKEDALYAHPLIPHEYYFFFKSSGATNL